MAKDKLAPKVSKPDGGFYESSDEIRAKDAAKVAAADEIEEAAAEVAEEEIPKEVPVPEPGPPPADEPPASVRVQRIRDSQK